MHTKNDQGADVERQPHGVGPAAGKLDHREVSVCAGSVTIQSSGTRLAKPMPSTTLATNRQPSTVQGLILSALKNSRTMLRKLAVARWVLAAWRPPSRARHGRPAQAADHLGPRRVLRPRSGAREIPPDAGGCQRPAPATGEGPGSKRRLRTRGSSRRASRSKKDVRHAWLPSAYASSPSSSRPEARPRRFGTCL